MSNEPEKELGFFEVWRREGWKEFLPTLKKGSTQLAGVGIGAIVGYFIPESSRTVLAIVGAACGLAIQTMCVFAWKMAGAPARVWRAEVAARKYAEQRLKEVTTPGLQVRSIEAIQSSERHPTSDLPVQVRTKIVRVKVRSLSQRTRGCSVDVVRLARIHEGKESEATGLNPIRLQWSGTQETQTDIAAGVDRYCDLLVSVIGKNEINFCEGVVRPRNLHKFFSVTPAVYRLDLVFTSQDAAALSQSVFISWSGRAGGLDASFSMTSFSTQGLTSHP
jgi:hypothetical protein